MSVQLSDKDAKDIRAYLQTIKTYSALVEKKLNACPGGVGTAQSERMKKKATKQIELEAEIRARFNK